MAKAKASSKKTAKTTKRKENKRIGIIVAIILIALVAIIGTTYAFFTTTLSGTKNNTIQVGTLVLDLKDTSEGVNIENAVPVTEKYALANYTAYTFTLENTGTVDAKYDLKLLAQALADGEEQLANEHIRYQLSYATTENAEAADKTVAKGLLSELTKADTFYSGTINANTKIYYELILWVDQNATKEEVAGTKYVGKISVEAIQNYGTEE